MSSRQQKSFEVPVLDYAARRPRFGYLSRLIPLLIVSVAGLGAATALALTPPVYSAVAYVQVLRIHEFGVSTADTLKEQQDVVNWMCGKEFRAGVRDELAQLGISPATGVAGTNWLHVEAIPESGLIRVSTEHRDQHVALQITNSALDRSIAIEGDCIVEPIRRAQLPLKGSRSLVPSAATPIVLTFLSLAYCYGPHRRQDRT